MSDAAIVLDPHEEHGGHGGHHGHDNPNLQHHFANPTQQFQASKLGMWLFLATEVLLFGGLFVGFGLMQRTYPQAFLAGHEYLDWRLGFLNTCILLLSSWTMVMGVWSAEQGKTKQLRVYLLITLACAAAFLVVKYFEYSHKIEEGLLPGRFYTHEGGVPNEFIFFSFYFMMTGLHGCHILGGMGAIGWLWWKAGKGAFDSSYYTPVECIGLYWHLVDLIWIYLFPLLYLIT